MLHLGLSYRGGLLCVCHVLFGLVWKWSVLNGDVSTDRDASSCDAILAVRIPLFAIHAEDDPVCPALPFR